MSDPKRYLEAGRSDLKSELLRSARDDGPSDASLQRALVAAALATGATAATGTASASVSLVAFLKWLGIGALIGGVGALGASAAFEQKAPAPKAPSVALVTPAASALEQGKPASPEPSPVPATSVALPAGSATAGLPPAAPVPSASEAPATPSDTLAEELRRIDAARRRLGSGDARGALSELDAYKQDFPRGRFAEEAALLRAESFVALGDCSAARAVARGLGSAESKSVLGRRWAALRQRCP